MTQKTSRHGKHKDGNVLLGAMVEPRKKAIAIVTASVLAGDGKPISQSDIVWRGIENLAIGAGVLDSSGDVTPDFKDAVTIAEAAVTHTNKVNRGTRGGKRGVQ